MKSYSLLTIATLLFATSGVIAAEEEKKEKESPWKITAGLGYVNTSGNTNTETLIFKIDAAYEIEKWKHEANFDTLNTSTDDVSTADRMRLNAQSNYKFRERDYFFGSFYWEDDEFSGFEYQTKLIVGYGRKIIKTDKHELDGEVGPGYRYFKPDNSPSDDEALLRLAGKYKWTISDYSNFTQDLFYDYGEQQEEWRSVTALRTSVYESLALRLQYEVRYLDVVPVGTNNYDRTTTVSLDYEF
jgi:putative salt-induced outer membrane protein